VFAQVEGVRQGLGEAGVKLAMACRHRVRRSQKAALAQAAPVRLPGLARRHGRAARVTARHGLSFGSDPHGAAAGFARGTCAVAARLADRSCV
jgi:hypothetical protein